MTGFMKYPMSKSWLILLLIGATAAAAPAPRLPESPFPVSSQPSSIRLLNLTGTSFDYRVMALSAVGVVAQVQPPDSPRSRGFGLRGCDVRR